jgi:hypothetical protein
MSRHFIFARERLYQFLNTVQMSKVPGQTCWLTSWYFRRMPVFHGDRNQTRRQQRVPSRRRPQQRAESIFSNDIHARFFFFHRAVPRNNALVGKHMTNNPSGSKRPYDGSADTELRKRSRDSESRDWKDARPSVKSHGARDRRTTDDRYRRDYSPRRDRDRDHRGRDDRRERDNRRDRSRRDNGRYRDRRYEDRGRRSSYADERRHTPESPRRPSNGSSRPRRTPDSDREEGE